MKNYPEAGAEFLDEKVPGWAEQINLTTFNISSLTDCVLGQLYGNYYSGLSELGLNQDADPDHYGFRVHSRHSGRFGQAWETVRDTQNAQWRDEILQRLDPNKPKPTHEPLLTDDEKHILRVLVAEQRTRLQKVYRQGDPSVGDLLEKAFRQQALALEQIELKLELA